jgi:hypothetical protein
MVPMRYCCVVHGFVAIARVHVLLVVIRIALLCYMCIQMTICGITMRARVLKAG